MFQECPRVSPPYPAALVERSRELLQAVLALMPPHLPLRRLAQAVARRYPAHARAAEQLAALVGVEPLDLLLANLCYDLGMGSLGCSTLALATPEGPVLARNMDWIPPGPIARASCLLPLEHGTSAGFVGAVGVITGLSCHGFAVALNAVPGRLNPEGYPVLLFLRSLVDEARSFDDALDRTCRTPLACSALITLVGTHNHQRACVERTASDCEVRRPAGDEPLVTTNHYHLLAPPDDCSRFCYLATHAPAGRAVSDEELLDLLARPEVRQDITAQHVIARPAHSLRGNLRLFVPAGLLEQEVPGGVEQVRQTF